MELSLLSKQSEQFIHKNKSKFLIAEQPLPNVHYANLQRSSSLSVHQSVAKLLLAVIATSTILAVAAVGN